MPELETTDRLTDIPLERLITVEPPPTALQSLITAMRRFPTDRGERSEEYQPFPDWAGKNMRQSAIEVPLMVKALRLPAGARVLEVGCGRGVGLASLASLIKPSRLVGLDIERSLLTDARAHLDRMGQEAELFWADVRRMPFPDESFDVVVDFGTCFHIAHPHRALGEITRVLSDGGIFVHETRLGQFLSHPLRSMGRAMPLEWFPQLRRVRWMGLWTRREKRTGDSADHSE